ncbi:hypothetical protein L596_029366 [Steinernema carpocapsae]|uniref:SKP1 component POZ domain-containing protein n=1 Tax=Steinernema carpocapsae TaxID=34508 RepID=A0A4U5LUF0_STECR|nr:hypothetical protein L596_029366 [Steinernema carpocapsae]
MLKQMLNDLGFEEDGIYPEEGIPLPSVEGEALGKILKWLEIHANEEPRSAPDAPLQPKRRQGGQRALRHLRASTEAGGCDQRGLLPRDAGLDRLADQVHGKQPRGKRGGEDGRVARDSSEEGRRTSGRRRRKTTKREDRLKKEDAIEHFLTSD